MIDGTSIEETAETTAEVLDLSQVDRYMKKVFNTSRNAVSIEDETTRATVQVVNVEIDAVEEMISKASKAIEILSTRCEILEQELSEAADHAAEQDNTIDQWKNLATDFQIQASTGRKIISDLMTRVETAETRIGVLEAAEMEAKNRVNIADALSNKLRGRVIAAFGQQSRIHSVIEATTFQEAAE